MSGIKHTFACEILINKTQKQEKMVLLIHFSIRYEFLFITKVLKNNQDINLFLLTIKMSTITDNVYQKWSKYLPPKYWSTSVCSFQMQ